jgi:hypothetical protein
MTQAKNKQSERCHPLKGTCQEKTLLPKKNFLFSQVLLNRVTEIFTIAEISFCGVNLHCTSHPSGLRHLKRKYFSLKPLSAIADHLVGGIIAPGCS